MLPCPARVISLERTPYRLEAFRHRLQDLATNVSWQPGVDGTDLDIDALVRQGVLSPSAAFWPRGQIGCALSHLEAWRACQSSGESLLVFEDDVLLGMNWCSRLQVLLRQLPEAWDFLLLGWNQDSCLQWEWSRGCSATALFRPRSPEPEQLQAALDQANEAQPFKLLSGLGLAGYVISASGAARLLDWALPLRTLSITTPELPSRDCFSLDGQLNACYRDLQAFVCIPPLAAGANQQSQSLTQH